MNSKIKLSNNSSVAILIFVILKFWNIGPFTFEHSKFCTRPFSNLDKLSNTLSVQIILKNNHKK